MVPKFFSALAFAALALVPLIAAFDIDSSNWIWTNEVSGGNVPVGARAFRKNFVAPLGKTPIVADIILAVDNSYSFYVNGIEVGTGSDFQTAGRFCVPLDSCLNVFAVTAINGGTSPNPAGLIAAIEVTYSDGTTSTIISDTTWRYSLTVPSGYEQLTYDDNSWSPAISEGAYGVSPWGLISVPSFSVSVLSLANSEWIWTNELSGGNAPPGSRAFRRTFTPTSQTLLSGTVIMAADNAYTLYVNGVLIGSGTDWHTAQTYSINFLPAAQIVFAVFAQNEDNAPNPAGLIAAIEINTADSDCPAGITFVTDGGWKANTGTPVGFELPDYDDSDWPAATVQGRYGVSPWGDNVAIGGPGPATPIDGAPARL